MRPGGGKDKTNSSCDEAANSSWIAGLLCYAGDCGYVLGASSQLVICAFGPADPRRSALGVSLPRVDGETRRTWGTQTLAARD